MGGRVRAMSVCLPPLGHWPLAQRWFGGIYCVNCSQCALLSAAIISWEIVRLCVDGEFGDDQSRGGSDINSAFFILLPLLAPSEVGSA